MYSHLEPVSSLRVVQVMRATALLMPWFQCPERTEQELEAVKLTLTNDFQRRGFRHDDVAWRNVGIYEKDGETKAVVFDMQGVVASKEDEEYWITEAIEALSSNLL